LNRNAPLPVNQRTVGSAGLNDPAQGQSECLPAASSHVETGKTETVSQVFAILSASQ
jgi:hypothetical protein